MGQCCFTEDKIKDSGLRELGYWQENDSFVLWEGNDRRLINKNMRDQEMVRLKNLEVRFLEGYEVVVRKWFF